MKHLLLLLVIFLTGIAGSAQGFQYLKLKTASGTEQAVKADRLKIVFTTDQLVATDASGATTQVALADVACMYFTDSPTPAPTKGDVNHDGEVNVSDVTLLVSMILGEVPTDASSADITGDGNIDVSDVTALINIILNASTLTPPLQ
ncbi:MAG: dockerin type I repeat-containing protein [Bacteroidales bacterium]|nr:dockerin type I repeat-containing protein [Bacteroidales bacterium]